jgi:DnaJ-class molecular chaperone
MNFYEILSVPQTASLVEIRKAYIQASLKYHPDRNDSESAPEDFKKVSDAYYILSDPERRKAYDQEHIIPNNLDVNPSSVFGSVFEEMMIPEGSCR